MKKLDHITFQHKSIATIRVDPNKGHKKYRNNWIIAECDDNIRRLYRWFLKRNGREVLPNTLWGFHISVVKGEEPLKNIDDWMKFDGKKIEFWYSNWSNYSNGRHAWLDCYSDDLCELRDYYGLPVKLKKSKFHMTIGNLKVPFGPSRPRQLIKETKTGTLWI